MARGSKKIPAIQNELDSVAIDIAEGGILGREIEKRLRGKRWVAYLGIACLDGRGRPVVGAGYPYYDVPRSPSPWRSRPGDLRHQKSQDQKFVRLVEAIAADLKENIARGIL